MLDRPARSLEHRASEASDQEGEKARLCQFVLNEIASREDHSRCEYTGLLHLQMLLISFLPRIWLRGTKPGFLHGRNDAPSALS